MVGVFLFNRGTAACHFLATARPAPHFFSFILTFLVLFGAIVSSKLLGAPRSVDLGIDALRKDLVDYANLARLGCKGNTEVSAVQ
jgi:hypothetical protein